MKKNNRKNRKLTLICVFVGVISMLVGCGIDEIDISSYENQKLVLSGVKNKDIVLSIGDLKKMELVTEKTQSTSDKIGVVRATGPLLDTVLEKYGKKQSDYSKIIVTAKDEYTIRISKKVLQDNDFILAFGIDGKPLDKESAPLRLIIPESDSAYWIRMITKIEMIK